jgi:hypothetical protein
MQAMIFQPNGQSECGSVSQAYRKACDTNGHNQISVASQALIYFYILKTCFTRNIETKKIK